MAEADLSAVAQAIADFCHHYHDRPNYSVAVAVSGGSDSVALLLGAVELAATQGATVHGVTVDHGLRSEAENEAQWVAELCKKHGARHTTLTVPNLTKGAGLQARARDARYAALIEWARAHKTLPVLLGHTQNDVAETFLMRIARGSGTAGLAEMRPDFKRDGIQFARPLTKFGREDLRTWLTEQGQEWVDDPSNDDDAYDRVKIRKLLPQLAQVGLSVEKLSAAAGHIRDAQTALEDDTAEILRRAVTIDHGDALVDLTKLPGPAFERRRRVIMALLRWVGGKAYDPRGKEQWRLLQILGSNEGPKNVTRTLSGVMMRRDDAPVVRFSREYAAVSDLQTRSDEVWDRWAIDGPHAPNLSIRALGEALKGIPDWRDVGLPRSSLMASPAVFDGETLISAPVAGLQNGFSARIVADYQSFLLSR